MDKNNAPTLSRTDLGHIPYLHAVMAWREMTIVNNDWAFYPFFLIAFWK